MTPSPRSVAKAVKAKRGYMPGNWWAWQQATGELYEPSLVKSDTKPPDMVSDWSELGVRVQPSGDYVRVEIHALPPSSRKTRGKLK